ncbi:MAG TPA: ferritin family protein [Myxococcota bacterium]|nr:ferritin family protein [Myxococcota bacterium]HRY95652.1 ferritin family protein [Myxococcota bacterium]HSA23983.1 ferritin family protein [Myxococcota bacterium]
MDQATRRRLAEGLARAMQAEVDGHHFYRLAAQSTPDPKGREVFEQLAREEHDHFDFLKAQQRAILETGQPDAHAHLGSQAALEGPSPIFSEGFRARIKEAHFEMTALSVAIQLEESSFKFYDAQAAKAKGPAVKAFFRQLADWERRHHAALQRQHEAYKEEYWHASGFSPF